ncbi:2-amino-4-hydroxy-6-hydroxymethyldihydropteridine pyrophosphokinase FolK [Methyloglobulus morosus KoM1]|uniref:2-amino-4-hydroxy-6-hydroxymethyldihydropteridine pyrophosphokinase n=1 Tax=Methyloglobulus morosus KoM1 TaxID=1116472 RepID=V5C2F4_9GAMM|nr:2-amino-4-hydroxy-6-hydroxymethyldihydropteridine diphosphokinase [Methyloglobulus morosus]ESS72632.1 2-amino-4-hydroxy-6-hydroxymethyldihydropteridine pyrophosphokinase FolK [Methyloglobulus morosus KoM1]
MNNPKDPQTVAYIGMGSNLESPVAQIKSARLAISALTHVKELAFSSLYVSSPMGPQEQPDYINAVMAVATCLSPLDLLHALQAIELEHGRVRGVQRWGARTLDLDLLLYGDRQIDTEELVVPHKGIAERAFVLYPLSECAPELNIPGHGDLSYLLPHCPIAGLRRLNEDESAN